MTPKLSRLSLFSLALCGFASGLPLAAQAQSACVPDAPVAGDSVACAGAGDGIRDDGLDGVTISVAAGAEVSSATEIVFELDDDVTLINDGTISSGGDHAIQLDNGGTIINSGTIESTDSDGINADNDTSITNSGTITGGDEGIQIEDDSSVVNSGTITGADRGIDGDSFTGILIENSGTITGIGNDAIRVGADAVIENSGTITGDDEGVDFGQDSSLVNSGSITGTDRGVDGEVSGIRITNSGSITGVDSDGVRTGADAVVENSGTITGGDDGVQVRENSTVINSGTITALGAEGINANRDGVRIENSGTIIGLDDAVNLANDAYVLNTGTILSNGTDQDGVDLDSGTVINHGTIRSLALTDGDGIDFDEGATGAGFVLNTGLIEGARGVNADDLDTQSQTVTNYGTIIGHSGIAISLAGGDDVLELATGSQIIGAIDLGSGTDTFRLLSPVQGAFSFITAPEIFDAGGNPFIASADGLAAVAADPDVMSAGDTLAARGLTSVLGNALELAEGAPGFAALLTSTHERDEMEGVLRYGFALEDGTVLSVIGGLMSSETEDMPGGVDVDYSMALVGPAASRDVGAARATVLGFIGTSETEYDAAAHVGGHGTADGTLYGVAGRFSYAPGQLGVRGMDLALSGGLGWHDMGDFSLSTLGEFDGRTPRTGFARVELGQSVELGTGTLRGLIRLTHVSGAGDGFTLRALGGSTSFGGTGLDSDTFGGIGAEYLQPLGGGGTLRLRLVAEGTDEDDMAVGLGLGVTF
ncbi:hypothetical protein GVY41_09430 [Frigidibacter albus]|uniref:Autotransporter domain-containing protein n=1 Tax=Frigidibacter albus TaxID=1465486 RepID=A0A6L8VJ16_9RHOB|nr:hypothetical protein [Frigidibacter albus]MZQ89309.1 hypothetical protein [Frigidibacter albus]NBE31215.1 hypothetical protein [Frigidibacter albus]GGH53515.1 hypothetical protein GCM10011341_19040 [Frigidibacter albus]